MIVASCKPVYLVRPIESRIDDRDCEVLAEIAEIFGRHSHVNDEAGMLLQCILPDPMANCARKISIMAFSGILEIPTGSLGKINKPMILPTNLCKIHVKSFDCSSA